MPQRLDLTCGGCYEEIPVDGPTVEAAWAEAKYEMHWHLLSRHPAVSSGAFLIGGYGLAAGDDAREVERGHMTRPQRAMLAAFDREYAQKWETR